MPKSSAGIYCRDFAGIFVILNTRKYIKRSFIVKKDKILSEYHQFQTEGFFLLLESSGRQRILFYKKEKQTKQFSNKGFIEREIYFILLRCVCHKFTKGNNGSISMMWVGSIIDIPEVNPGDINQLVT